MAACDEDALALKLTKLVARNYPYLETTTIPVLDVRECARRGTAEQRQTGQAVREVMGDVWALEDGHPLRKLMEGFVAHEEAAGTAVGAGDRAGAVAWAAQEGVARASRTLPSELVHRVLEFFMSEVSPPGHALQFVAFGHLLLVSKAIANYARAQHQDLFERYTDRVVSNVLHGKSPPDAKVASVVYRFAILLGQVRKLHVYLYGDEIDMLNALLPLLTQMAILSIYLHLESVPLCDIAFEHNRRLREVDVRSPECCINPATEMDIQMRRRWSEEEQNTLEELLEGHSGPHHNWSAPPPALRQLDLNATSWAEHSVTLDCLEGLLRQSLVTEVTLSETELTLSQLQRLGLAPSRFYGAAAIRSLDLSHNINLSDEALRGLRLTHNLNMTDLNLDDCHFTDPSVLGLASNSSIARLRVSANALSSGTFGLATNKTLRVLDCSKCPPQCGSAKRQRFLRDLSADLNLNTTLEELCLAGRASSYLEDEDLAVLDLSSHTGLRRLDLTGNYTLSAAGVQALRLRTNPALQDLFVTNYDEFVEEWEAELAQDAVVKVVDREESLEW